MRGDFKGTERFEILRRLGAGGMGVVYEAFDRTRGERVALKTLQLADAAAIYRFKNEFRALADLSHANLVTLFELFASEETIFFTMELVVGTPFLTWVCGGAESVNAITLPAAGGANVVSRDVVPRARFDEGRLRRSMRQLAGAVYAAHAGGKLHRDIKPSNVMVDADERIVLLDFGLVQDIEVDARGRTSDEFAGTPEYMAPEQGAGMPLSEASDWYAVGCVLFEALTGCLPFEGPKLKVLMDKQTHDAPVPSALTSDVPSDLEALCIELLRRDPAKRPRGAEVLRRLGASTRVDSPRSLVSVASTINAPFIGRERHLTALQQALEATKLGRTTIAFVHGASGMGKSALVRRFLDAEAQRPDTVVLVGRCYEQESVPFKAFDGIIDALSRELIKRKRDAAALLPRDIHTLSRVFPVLRRVEAIASAPRPACESPDPQELRRRAFRALRELFARLGDRHTVILWIDDVQWGDADSAALIHELLRPPESPQLLLVASYRSEDSKSGDFLPVLLGDRGAELTRDAQVIEVGPLPHDDAVALARSLLGSDEHSEMIAQEASGSPYFVDELVRYAQSGVALRRSRAGETVRLDEVLHARFDQLPENALRLLETLAVAGRPTPRVIAVRAADIATEDERACVAVLRAGHLVRTLRTADEETLVTFHDRIRETVVARLPPEELRQRHRTIATALEGRGDEEALARHWASAGDRERAREHARRAADRAAETLAFDRAATFYSAALENHDDRDERRTLLAKLGDALANAGRGADAGRAYLAATHGAGQQESLELQRRASEQLLQSGHIDEGVATLDSFLGGVGMRLPATAWRAFLSIIVRTIWLSIRGLGFRARDPSEIPAHDLMRIDICWSVASGLAVVDNLRALDFSKRQLVLALRAGEPYRAARALAADVAVTAVGGTKTAKQATRVHAIAKELAERVPQPEARAFTFLVGGVAAYLQGRWPEALEACETAERLFRDRCTGVWWQIGNTQIFSLWALTQIGELAELERRMPLLLEEAQARGDLYSYANLQIGRNNIRWLALDQPTRAEQVVEDAMSKWPRTAMHLQHYYELLARCQIDLYRRDGKRALERVQQRWEPMRRAFMFRIQNVLIEALHLRARCLLAEASSAGASEERERLLRAATRDARRIERTGARWAFAHAQVVRATIAAQRAEVRSAAALLEAAARAFDEFGMKLCAHVARLRRGELLGGEAGRALVNAAEDAMRVQQIREPLAMAEMMAPGFPAGSATLS